MEPVTTQHIELRNNRDGQQRAYITGTRIRVQDIYAQSEVHGKTPDQIVTAFPHLTLSQVHAALAYYFDHRDEIMQELRQDDELVALMKARTGPGPLERKLKGSAGQGSAGQGSAGMGSAGMGSAGMGSAGLGSAGLGSAGQGSAGQGADDAIPSG